MNNIKRIVRDNIFDTVFYPIVNNVETHVGHQVENNVVTKVIDVVSWNVKDNVKNNVWKVKNNVVIFDENHVKRHIVNYSFKLFQFNDLQQYKNNL
jgi:hypothetical protein